MKKIICAVILLLGFAGCTATQINEPTETTQRREPPKMFLDYSVGGEAVRETVGYASAAWNHSERDTFPARLSIKKTENLEEIKISFELAPDSIEEIRVNKETAFHFLRPAGAGLERVTVSEYVLVLPDEEGVYDYMVRANWPQGRADYFFTVVVGSKEAP